MTLLEEYDAIKTNIRAGDVGSELALFEKQAAIAYGALVEVAGIEKASRMMHAILEEHIEEVTNALETS